MLGKFEDPEYTEDPDEDERSVLLGRLTIAVRLLDDQDDEVRKDGKQVEYVHHVYTELLLARAGHQSKCEFDGEPDYADRFNDEEGVSVVGLFVVCEAVVCGDVDTDWTVESWQSLHAEVCDRDHDTDDREESEYFGRSGTVRLLAK